MEKAANRPGRPRSESSRRSILDAAYQLLRDQTVDEVTVQALAGQAGVSSATIYRWWPTKEAVLLEGYLSAVGDRTIFDVEGRTPLADMRAGIAELAAFLSDRDGELLRRLMAKAQADPALHQSLQERLFIPTRAAAVNLVTKAIAQGDLRHDIDADLFYDATVGPLFARSWIGKGTVNVAKATQLFDLVVEGAKKPA